ncbi:hypothetical protein PoB_006156000 [Plakobranchus ocellatus]|uniref:Uncharacterized protein n=1 Tax=Plakobranchus ocellatus TaxID=259542 RepID=A0AAV4CT12_9GAST|nr:hypothetical protein PoB_006156000 [Plakobranchus ocellatus]
MPVALSWQFNFQYIASTQQGDLRLLGPPSGQSAGGGTGTRDRRIPADLRPDSPSTVPPRLPYCGKERLQYGDTLQDNSEHIRKNHAKNYWEQQKLAFTP